MLRLRQPSRRETSSDALRAPFDMPLAYLTPGGRQDFVIFSGRSNNRCAYYAETVAGRIFDSVSSPILQLKDFLSICEKLVFQAIFTKSFLLHIFLEYKIFTLYFFMAKQARRYCIPDKEFET